MKRLFLMALMALTAVSSCKEEIDVTEVNVPLMFTHKFNGNNVVFNNFYSNIAGNSFSFSRIKYFVGDVVLIKEDGTEIKTGYYKLIDAGPGKTNGLLSKVPLGNYKGIRFLVGVDSISNHMDTNTFDESSDLNPSNHENMYWGWSPGFIFFKGEGNYVRSVGDTSTFVYHLGFDQFLSTVAINQSFTITEKAESMFFDVNTEKLFSTPSVLDLKVDGDFTHSSENIIAPKLKSNLPSMFELNRVD